MCKYGGERTIDSPFGAAAQFVPVDISKYSRRSKLTKKDAVTTQAQMNSLNRTRDILTPMLPSYSTFAWYAAQKHPMAGSACWGLDIQILIAFLAAVGRWSLRLIS